MLRTVLVVILQAAIVTAASAGVAVATNLARPDGIPLVTDVEYDIFAPCRDSEADSEAASAADLLGSAHEVVLYVDARPIEAYAQEHVDGAINIPYSALFGASEQDIAMIKEQASAKKATRIIVYGVFQDPASPQQKVDFAKPLALQLVESEIKGVKHLEGGMEELKKSGIKTVKESVGAN